MPTIARDTKAQTSHAENRKKLNVSVHTRPQERRGIIQDHLNDHFKRWAASQSTALEELVTIEQFLAGLLRIWLCERKPTSLQQAATLADDYALAKMSSHKCNSSDWPPSNSGKSDSGRS